jgi:1,3-beta-glucan synthase
VIRYAILYFVMLIVFLCLIVGPVVAGKYLKFDLNLPLELIQPTGLNNNDTQTTATGSCIAGDCPQPGGAAQQTDVPDRLRFARHVAF